MGLSNLSECESKSAETPQACEAATIPNGRVIGSRKLLLSLI